MSRQFPGTGNITGTITAVDTGPWSMGCWFYLDDNVLLHRLMFVGPDANGQMMYMNGAQIHVCQVFSTTTMQRTASFAAFGTGGEVAWVCVVGVYADSLTAADSSVYLGDFDQAMADPGAGGSMANGIGTRVTGLNAGYIGNRNALDRPFNGRLAQAFFVPWQMTQVEAEQFRQGDWSVIYAHGQPRFFLPLTGASLFDVGGSTGLWTATSATVGEDPPIAAGWSRANAISVISPVAVVGGNNTITLSGALTTEFIEGVGTITSPVIGVARQRTATHYRPFRWATYSQRTYYGVRDVVETPQSVSGAITPVGVVPKIVSKNMGGGFVP